MPAQESKYDDQDPPIAQAAQIWGEGPEIVPYAAGFKPLYPKAMIDGYTGYEMTGSVSGSGTATDMVLKPTTQNLEWVAGDTAHFQFFLPGVALMPDDPGTIDPSVSPWQRTKWDAQVRNPGYWYYGYWWPPVWPGFTPFIMAFTIKAEYGSQQQGTPPTTVYGTVLTLTGGTIWPGDFVWDLQSEVFTANVPPPPTEQDTFYTKTWMSGKAKVDTQVTQPDLYPPSNWPVYRMPWE